MSRLSVPTGLADWFDRQFQAEELLKLKLRWGHTDLSIGELNPSLGALKYQPSDKDFTKGPERTDRLLAKALSRAGWQRPLVDPCQLPLLLSLRRQGTRIEFIMDTNAMVDGVGHWLVDAYADRCDVVVTAVTLRELQDQKERAGFSKSMPDAPEKKGDMLGARQLYLAAYRFRECPGYNRVLWRELELDDTALLLSRGSTSGKTSESDTLLLRAVRRSVHARVNGLERFFVTGDTALARRATSELPAGSVIASQVEPLVPDTVYLPKSWWPWVDQGRRLGRHPSRLVWELLAIADVVVIEDTIGGSWELQAYADHLWPSDYQRPWVSLTPPEPTADEEEPEGGEGEDLVDLGLAIELVPTRLDRNLRFRAETVLDTLAAIVTADGPVEIPERARSNSEIRFHTKLLLESLQLAEVDADCRIATHHANTPALRDAWKSDDLDGVFALLRGWIPLEEWATQQNPPNRPKRTQECARALVALLAQGMRLDDVWLPGGSRISPDMVRETAVAALPDEEPQVLTIYDLFTEVFLRRLMVHPVRAMAAWDELWKVGVFEGFEPRTGGSSTGKLVTRVAKLDSSGWELVEYDLESFAGYRDFIFRSRSNE